MALILHQTFNVLRGFGREASQMKDVVAAFLFVLEEYPMPLIRLAFRNYLRQRSEIPTPADIVALIEGEQKLVAYINHLADGGGLTAEGHAYIEQKLGKNWRGQ